MAQRRVPVVVISGGLGSGKTTALNHLLGTGKARIGVIINDFGDINIDVLLVSGQVDAAQNVAGGCICCLTDTSELDDALRSLTRPSLELDAIVIESSGLAEPRELARLVLSSPVEGVRFGGLFVLLDAREFLTDSEKVIPQDRLKAATLVVLNKSDVLADGPVQVADCERVVRAANPEVPFFATTYGQIPIEFLVDAVEKEEPFGQLSLTDLLIELNTEHHHHHHVHYDSVSVGEEAGVDPFALVRLMESLPAGCVRFKGVTHFNSARPRERFVVHGVGGAITMERHRWPRGQKPSTSLVAIGAGWDAAKVEASMRACLTDQVAPEHVVDNLSRFIRP